MTAFFNRMFRIRAQYTNPVDLQQARGLLTTLAVAVVAWTLWVIYLIIAWLTGGDLGGVLDSGQIQASFLGFPPVVILVYWLIQTGRVHWAARLMVLFFFVGTGVLAMQRLDRIGAMMLIIPVVAAGVLLDRRSMVLVVLIAFAITASGILNQAQLTQEEIIIPAESVLIDTVAFITTVLLVLGFLHVFAGNLQRLIQQTAQDTTLFQKIARFNSTADRSDVNRVYTSLIVTLRDELDFNFAQVFLVDAEGHATQRLRAGLSTLQDYTIGDARLNPGNPVNEAIYTRQPVSVGLMDSSERRAQFMPASTFGFLLPVIVDEQVIAVLDVQSNDIPFTQTRIELLNTLIEQMVVMIRDVRIVQALRAELTEQEATNLNLRERLKTNQQRGPIATSSIWDQYLSGYGGQATGYDMQTGEITPAGDLSDELLAAFEKGDLHLAQHADYQVLSVPIRIREEVIGALAFHIPLEAHITERHKDLAAIVTNRLSLALETKRLFEQTQSQAQRERKASEIANMLISATDVDEVMSLAADRFNEALGAVRTRVYLQPESGRKEAKS